MKNFLLATLLLIPSITFTMQPSLPPRSPAIVHEKYDPNRTLLAVIYDDGSMKMFNTTTNACIAHLDRPTLQTSFVTFNSHEGSITVSDADGSTRIYDTTTNRCIYNSNSDKDKK